MIRKCEFTYDQFARVDDPLVVAAPTAAARLEEEAERALEVDELACVLEGESGLAVDQAAHDPVRVVGAGEQQELPERVQPTLRQPSAARGTRREP